MNRSSLENVAGNVFAQAELNPDKPAFLGVRKLTFKELAVKVTCFAAKISDVISDRDAIVILSFNDDCLEIIAFLACSMLGQRCSSVSRRNTISVWLRQVASVQGEWVLCDEDIPASDAYRTLRIQWSDLNTESSSVIFDNAADMESPFILVTSSGSTGTPKAFYLSQSMLSQRILQRIRFFQITPEDVFLRVSSMSYIGSKVRALSALSAGASVVISPSQHPRELIALMLEHSVTFISMIVLQADQIMSFIHFEKASVPHDIRVLELSASSVTREFREKIIKGLTANVYVTYSTNETGAISIALPEDVANIPGTVGMVLEDVKVRIIDNKKQKLPDGSTGLICVKTSQMTTNYLNSHHLSRYFTDGFFVTGDVGYIDTHSQLVHLGRADDLMIVNGVNVYPAEIESQIQAFPGILDVKAIAFNHPVMQSFPVCLVTTKAGILINEEELIRFANEKLGNKAPRRFLFVDIIPRNDLGKIDWNALQSKIRDLLNKDTVR